MYRSLMDLNFNININISSFAFAKLTDLEDFG